MEKCSDCGKIRVEGIKWSKDGLCRTCYKRHWRHKTGKTNTKWRELSLPTISISDLQHQHKLAIAEKAINFLKQGKTIEEVKSVLNIPETTISRWVKLAGFDHRKYKIENLKINPTLKYIKQIGKEGMYEVQCEICSSLLNKTAHDLKFGCGVCLKNSQSAPEQEISQWLTSNGIEHVKHDRVVLAPKEIDIYVPSMKIGIEYCGLYWHSSVHKPTNYHYEKMKTAEKAGIRLITIFENEWLERKEQVLNFLSSVFKVESNTVYARKCEIKQLESKESVEFMDANHIQKASKRSLFHVGLVSDGQLIAVMTAGKHHRQGYDDALVLDRLCFKSGYNVPGGASRLFKQLVSYAKENGYKRIISWSDNRWSQGQVYKMLNFVLESEVKYDYSYVKGPKIISKQSMKKSEIKKRFPDVYSPEKTEKQMTEEIGLNRIWDCGKKRWTYSL